MERVIILYLHKYLIKNYLYDKYQRVFTPKRSTLDNLTRLSQEIIDGFKNNEITAGVFFDVDKAFDQISQTAILKIQDLGMTGRMYNFLSNSKRFCIRLSHCFFSE